MKLPNWQLEGGQKSDVEKGLARASSHAVCLRLTRPHVASPTVWSTTSLSAHHTLAASQTAAIGLFRDTLSPRSPFGFTCLYHHFIDFSTIQESEIYKTLRSKRKCGARDAIQSLPETKRTFLLFFSLPLFFLSLSRKTERLPLLVPQKNQYLIWSSAQSLREFHFPKAMRFSKYIFSLTISENLTN